MSGLIVLLLRTVLAISLYAFLLLAFYLLWRSLRLASQQTLDRKLPPLNLILERGDERVAHTFSQANIVVGREPGCELCVPDTTVSARHARFIYRQDHWWVEDLNSRNGTYLNQEKVTLPIVLTNGDTIRCGNVALKVHLDSPATLPDPSGTSASNPD